MKDECRFHEAKEPRAHAGQVLVMVAIGMVVLVGFLALSVDVGFALAERGQVQSAADSAALAAAQAARQNASNAQITLAAQAYGATNAGVIADDVVVELPPTDGEYAGDDNFIRVSITKDVQRFFLDAIFNGDWQVSATATAGIVPEGFDAAMLALNPDSGGIKTRGNSTITVNGGSIVSNFDINTGGSTTITADQWVVANDGFNTSGDTKITGGVGTNTSGPEVPDPLADLISPPVLPAFPSNPVPNVGSVAQPCFVNKPGYYPPPTAADYVGYPGIYSGHNCVEINGQPSYIFEFNSGNYKFINGAGLKMNFQKGVRLLGGTYNFVGGPGIEIGGNAPFYEMRKGRYAFLNGASLKIGGSAPNNNIGAGGTTATDSYFYFSGGGGLSAGGWNSTMLYPGTYIFDGGPGMAFGGSDKVTFNPGTYEFYFNKGADLQFHGDSKIFTIGDVYVKMYFYGTPSDSSDLKMDGSTTFNIPSGEYYFDRGKFTADGNSTIFGDKVFLYFKNGSYLATSGSARFGFTAPETEVYPGYYPSVFMYSDASNTAPFTWTGSTISQSVGTVYLPSSKLIRTGSSFGLTFTGQMIADSFDFSGGNSTTITYQENVTTTIPQVFLVE